MNHIYQYAVLADEVERSYLFVSAGGSGGF